MAELICIELKRGLEILFLFGVGFWRNRKKKSIHRTEKS